MEKVNGEKVKLRIAYKISKDAGIRKDPDHWGGTTAGAGAEEMWENRKQAGVFPPPLSSKERTGVSALLITTDRCG